MSAYSATSKPQTAAKNHWHQLRVLLQQCPAMADLLLRRPCPALPSHDTDLEQLEQYARQAALTTLFAKHLLSGLLLAGNCSSDICSEYTRQLIHRHLPELDPETAINAAWTRVPILTCQGQTGSVVWFLLGRTDCGTVTGCGSPIADPTAHRAIVEALRQVSGTGPGYAYWSLQDDQEPGVHGTSLGLPIVLAAWILNQGLQWPGGLFATGAVDANRRLHPVAHIEEKYKAAAWENRLFLMPTDVLPDAHGDLAGTLSCDTLDDALFAVSWFSRGISPEKSSLYQSCLHDPDLLLSSFHALPAELLSFPQYRKPLLRIEKTPEKYLGKLSDCLQRCGYDPTRGQYLVRLCPAPDVGSLIDRLSGSGLDLFRWCLAQISYRNHLGNVSGCREWIDLAARLGKKIGCDPEIGQFFNHRMVTLRFNRYDFRPEPPEELAAFLHTEERLREIAPRDNWTLGAIYGTLAQNYGFCGPKYLDDLVKAAARAEEAFGLKYDREKKRLVNYRIHALLDANRTDEATSLLPGYLELEPSSGPQEWYATGFDMLNTPEKSDKVFQAALVFRFLADTGYRPADTGLPGLAAAVLKRHSHPWQLIALNLGQLLLAVHLEQEADILLRHSVRICESGGETLRPMALLPLAKLHETGLATDRDYNLACEIQDWIRQTDQLEQDHFQSILTVPDGRELLDTVCHWRARLFPFSYR